MGGSPKQSLQFKKNHGAYPLASKRRCNDICLKILNFFKAKCEQNTPNAHNYTIKESWMSMSPDPHVVMIITEIYSYTTLFFNQFLFYDPRMQLERCINIVHC